MGIDSQAAAVSRRTE